MKKKVLIAIGSIIIISIGSVVLYAKIFYKRPYVVLISPENGATAVNENAFIITSILRLPNGGLDSTSLNSNTVYLTETANGKKVPATISTANSGKVLKLTPHQKLKLNSSYIFTITEGVKDISGKHFISRSDTFTTGSIHTGELLRVKFDKVPLPNSKGVHSSLTIGPDGKLYALCLDGIIKRFTINDDGTLGTPELIYTLQDKYGKRNPRLAIGFEFDPSASSSNLVAWVTHSSFMLSAAPDWDGKLTRLSGSYLENAEDVLINLPRSIKDHLTNSIAFGPDGALYFTQGSNTAMGAADKTWGNRPEHLLSATVLRLDTKKLNTLPLDVKTPEGGGNYDPYATNAPLTIYATGIRNAYDLLWHSNGELYVPTNGSAEGGNAPSSVNGYKKPNGTYYYGAQIPPLVNIQQVQKDFLFRIQKGGYYGHPNPLRGEYVMNGGNPTSKLDPAQVNAYPIGTLPDSNWRGLAFDFNKNKSPNGIIEYSSNTFNKALKGKLLVVRYSRGSDIIVLTAGGDQNDIVGVTEGISIEGFYGFVLPLDLIEDVRSGNIYVSEFGGECITLLRPRE